MDTSRGNVSEAKAKPCIQVEEFQRAWKTLLRLVQRTAFDEELAALSKRKSIASTSSLFKLSAFIGSDGLLRVGGRLDNSQLDYEHKHPVILPMIHPIPRLIIRHVHQESRHPGLETTFANVVEDIGFSEVEGQFVITYTVVSRANASEQHLRPH